MLRNRNLRRSIRSHIQTVLESASSYGMSQDYNVYDEEAMRLGETVTFPFIYLVDSAIRPTNTELPCIVLETQITKSLFELGNRSGRALTFFLHVFGKTRGERDDLASMFQDDIGQAITVYNYSTGSGVADGTRIELDPIVPQFDVPLDKEEASLLNLTVVSYSGITTT